LAIRGWRIGRWNREDQAEENFLKPACPPAAEKMSLGNIKNKTGEKSIEKAQEKKMKTARPKKKTKRRRRRAIKKRERRKRPEEGFTEIRCTVEKMSAIREGGGGRQNSLKSRGATEP